MITSLEQKNNGRFRFWIVSYDPSYLYFGLKILQTVRTFDHSSSDSTTDLALSRFLPIATTP